MAARRLALMRAGILFPLAVAVASPAAAGPLAVDLPAGHLGASVAMLARQTGTSIAVDSAALWSSPVPAMRGRMEATRAIRRLAGLAGAEAKPAGPHLWRIVARPPKPVARAIAPIALAATPAPPAGEIVVTASKRDIALSDYPGQANRIDAAALAIGQPGGTDAVAGRLATLSSTHLGSGRNKLFIRGIADSSFTGPTQATVGQYLGDLRLGYNAADPDLRLYDVASVEVLEGPQGTLYGAGSLGGVMRINPAAPQLGAWHGSLTVGASAIQHGAPGGDAAAMLNLPVAGDRAALRVVGYADSEGGYIDNPQLGRNDINRTRIRGGRATVRVAAGDGWTIDLGTVLQSTHGRDSQYADADGDGLTRESAVREGFDARFALGQAVIAKDWGGLRFQSSTGYVSQHLEERFDATIADGRVLPGTGALFDFAAATARLSTGEPRLFVQHNRTRLFSSENRLWRPMRGGFGWVIGASWLHNRTRLGRAIGTPENPVPATGVENRIREFTAFGEVGVQVFPGLTVNGGARLTTSHLAGTAENVPAARVMAAAELGTIASRRTTRLLPSWSAVFTIRPRIALYARYQTGFRPGGLAIEGDFVRRFDSDRVTTLETGLRLGRPRVDRVDLTVALSHTEWSNIQADFIDASGLPSTANIGDGRIWTASASAGFRPIPSLRIEAAAAWNDGRIEDPAPALFALATTRMSRVPNVAHVVARVGADHDRPLGGDWTLSLSGWVRYVGKSRLGIGPLLGDPQGDYWDSALHARIGRPAWGITMSLTNLSDETGNRFALGTPFSTGRRQITPLRPRTVRIGFDGRF